MSSPQVILKPKGLRHVLSGHPWVFREGIAQTRAENGDIVQVIAPNGKNLGYGMYSSASRIVLRMMSRGDRPVDETEIRRRLQFAVERRTNWLRDSDCVRLVHAEADGLPALVVDKYASTIVVQATSAGSERILPVVLDELDKYVEIETVVARHDLGVRAHENLPQEVRVLRGEVHGCVEVSQDHRRQFVDVERGQKTGLYLDQRANRESARNLVHGGRILDVFCYQAEFAMSVANRAEEVIAVDSSAAALERAERAVEANDLGKKVRLIKAKAIPFLRGAADSGESFDVVLLDPPAFAKSRRDLDGARRGYREINLQAMRLLNPGGLMITSSCSYHMSEEDLSLRISEAAADLEHTYHVVGRGRQGLDHPVLLGHPESLYLKTLFLRRVN